MLHKRHILLVARPLKRIFFLLLTLFKLAALHYLVILNSSHNYTELVVDRDAGSYGRDDTIISRVADPSEVDPDPNSQK